MLAHANDAVPGRLRQRTILQTKFLDFVGIERPQRLAILRLNWFLLTLRNVTQGRL